MQVVTQISSPLQVTHCSPTQLRAKTLSSGLSALLIFCLICTVVFCLPPVSRFDGYFGSVQLKEARLKTIGGPKIVLVGGSNLAFGVASPLIEERLGLPTVNMGISSNLGLRFMLEEIKNDLHNGDVVILCPEHQLLFGLLDGCKDMFRVVQAYPPAFHSIFSAYILQPENLTKLLKNFKELVSVKCRLWYKCCFYRADFDLLLHPDEGKRTSFNSWGDYIPPSGKDCYPFEDQEICPGCEIDKEALAVLNKFSETMSAKGVRVLIVPPPTAVTSFRTSTQKVQALYRSMRQGLKIAVVANPERYVFERNNCFDSPYHLKAGPGRIRTIRLIEDVQSHLD
jgi:hypothetical protein